MTGQVAHICPVFLYDSYYGRNNMRKSILIAICAMAVLLSASFAYADAVFDTFDDRYDGKTVILQTNDVHGAIDQYKYLAGVKEELIKRGADVYVVDSGDFLQGTIYVSWDKGSSALKMMNSAGYDIVTIGNHDFDYGCDRMMELLKDRNFDVICDNVIVDETGKALFDGTEMITNGDLKIGFFGIDTPTTKTTSSPVNTKGLTFYDNTTDPKIYDQALADVKSLRSDGADVVLGLSHLGVDDSAKPYRSYELWDAVKSEVPGEGADVILDGHSHTVMTSGDGGQPIMSTGTKLVNIGVIVIDEQTEKIDKRFLYEIKDDTWVDADVKVLSDQIDKEVDDLYGQTVCTSDVELNGYRDKNAVKEAGKDFPSGNRDGESNTGDFAADAYKAQAIRLIEEGEKYDVDQAHIVAMLNGGAIRAGIQKGDVTRKDLLTTFPFFDSVCGVYVKGSELLEVLEASTFDMPEAQGGFPQVSGISYSINIGKPYCPNPEPYPGTTYYGPEKINRVTIKSINGQPFDPDGDYLVITNYFSSIGGDTYYVLGQAEKRFDTGILDIDAMIAYVTDDLGGKITTRYEDPEGRITVVKGANTMSVKTTAKKASAKKLKKKAVKVSPIKVTKPIGTVRYKKTGGSKKLTVNKKTGVVTVKKGTKKAVYKIRVRVSASGNDCFKAKNKTVTVKVKVR